MDLNKTTFIVLCFTIFLAIIDEIVANKGNS